MSITHSGFEGRQARRFRPRRWPLFAAVLAALATGVALGLFCYAIVTPQGTLIAVIGCSVVIALGVGGVAAVLYRRKQAMAGSHLEQRHLTELQRERDRFRAAVHAVHGVLWTNDSQGWMCGEQPAWATLTGQSYEQYQGFGWSSAIHPDDAEPTIEAWNAAVTDGRLFVFEHRVRCADGALRTFAVRAAPVRAADGSVREWVGIHTDISAQRASELTNTRLAAIVTSAQDAIISFAPGDGRIMTWNAAAERLFGYSEAEAVGGPVGLLVPAGLRTREPNGVFAAAVGGRPVIAKETVRVSKTGEDIPVAITATRMLAPDGRLLGVSGTFHDLRPKRHIETALREANAALERKVEERTGELVASEAKLRESEAGFRLLAEHGSDMVGRVSAEGTWQYVSPASARILGCDAISMVGHAPKDSVHPDDRSAVAAFQARVLNGDIDVCTIDVRAVHPDRGEIWIEIGARALRNPATGFPDGCVTSVRDATDRRLLELGRETQAGALQAANEELERSNRALDRLARHLARARDQADAANRAKSRFLATMSHELRTPLNGILGYAHLIRAEGNLSAIQAARVENMNQAGQHLLEMIAGVLSLSEVESDRIELQPVTVDLERIAATCLDVVRPSAAAKGLVIEWQATPDAPGTAVLDPTRLRQVLLNLLSNAVKFTALGCVTLRLRRASTDSMRFEVADTGPGIASDKHDRLFREFERLGVDRNEVDGAGLGLALSARLAAMMGGSMGYEDNEGGGSVFWLELPLGIPSAECTAQALLLPSDAPLRLLVVDDVAMNRDVVSAFLATGPYYVTCLDNGADAVAAVSRETFDVVLMDVRMPGMDGLEATRRIRALSGSSRLIPIIALTAQAFTEQIVECRVAGMDGHLTKPFSPEALLAVVAQAVNIGRNRSGPEQLDDDPSADAYDSETDGLVINHITFERTATLITPATTYAYLRIVAERSTALLQRLDRVEMAPFERDMGLEDAIHVVAGSAGLFGFEQMAIASQRLEFALQMGASDRRELVHALKCAIEASTSELADRILQAEQPAMASSD